MAKNERTSPAVARWQAMSCGRERRTASGGKKHAESLLTQAADKPKASPSQEKGELITSRGEMGTDNPAETDHGQIVEIADRLLDAVIDRLDKGTAPVWQAQFELGKMVITLSMATLVLSVSVAQFLSARLTDPSLGWLLPTSWFCFAAAVLTGAVRQAWQGKARSFRILFEAKRGEMRRRIHQLSDDANLGDQVEQIISDAFQEAATVPDHAVKVHNVLNHVMFWSFAAGLITLLVFATLNLPF